ncbi:SAVED domain-containing protein [Pseudorhodoplanes sinuspersici]|uniref:SAVED domain-containing protein n=1 Tax=Pseudorhodoplanes sinuspersici TaxID=1235591 RepID=UPI000E70F6E9|nr:SAVED domain-containing protein [Pseudorhodoplanes sinuspersici]
MDSCPTPAHWSEKLRPGRRLWAADDVVSDASWPTLLSESVELCTDQPDLAVAISLTHDVSADVRRYCEATLPHVGRPLILKPSTGSGAQSVACGRHAFELADATTTSVRAARPATGACLTHLFVAASNAFTFFLGQRQPALGSVRLYEFDFDGGQGRSYTPVLTVPVTLRNGEANDTCRSGRAYNSSNPSSPKPLGRRRIAMRILWEISAD